MRIYRGDTFKFDFSAKFEDGSEYTFQVGDIVKAGIKLTVKSTDYVVKKEMDIEEPTTEITFVFSHEDMLNAPIKEAVLEVELTDGDGVVSTIYQQPIEIVGDVINE